MHRHQLRKRKTCESCSGPLTTAKLTRSCADPNFGAIKYTSITMAIALYIYKRCNRIALEHHKCDKMRTSKAPNVGCHVNISGKAVRDLSRGYLVCLYAGGCPQQVTPAFPFAKRFFLEGATVANPHKENPPQARTGKNGCTNFSEISYGKTRGSYDRSAIAPGSRNASFHTNQA